MIIRVKMKDIPWSEISGHFRNAPANAEDIWERILRNNTVTLTGNKDYHSYQNIVGYETTLSFDSSGNFWACSICADIGD